MHVVGRSIAGFYDGIAQLVAGPHLGESLHRLMAQRWFRLELFIVARVVIDVGETDGEQLQRQFRKLRKCLTKIENFLKISKKTRLLKIKRK